MASSEPRRIAIDARSYLSSSGAYVRNLIAELQEIDQSTQYDVWVPAAAADDIDLPGSNFTVVPTSAGAYTLKEQISFLRHLLRRRYDLVHFAMQQQPVLYFRPRISTFHDLTLVHYDTTNSNALVNHVFRLVATVMFSITLRTSRLVIVPSEATRRAVQSFARIPARKTVVTLEAADVTSRETDVYPVKHDRFILYVGNFYAYKNVRRLIEAHQRLLVDEPDLGLVLVGRLHRAAQPLIKEIEQSGARNVTFTGYVTEGQRNWLFQRCEAYVFPSLSEGFGLPGLEAISFGAPVVAARATSLPEVYGDGAAYFDPFDVEDMAATIHRVVSDPELKDELRSAGERVLNSYSWRRTAEQTLAAYDLALSRNL